MDRWLVVKLTAGDGDVRNAKTCKYAAKKHAPVPSDKLAVPRHHTAQQLVGLFVDSCFAYDSLMQCDGQNSAREIEK